MPSISRIGTWWPTPSIRCRACGELMRTRPGNASGTGGSPWDRSRRRNSCSEMAKEPQYRFQCNFGINEVLSLREAVKYADKNAQRDFDKPQKGALRKLERETERIWKEHSRWR